MPKLRIGKMQLEGKEVTLKKPLAIMTLVKPEDGSPEYHAAGIVRRKYVFTARPVPTSRPAVLASAEQGAIEVIGVIGVIEVIGVIRAIGSFG